MSDPDALKLDAIEMRLAHAYDAHTFRESLAMAHDDVEALLGEVKRLRHRYRNVILPSACPACGYNVQTLTRGGSYCSRCGARIS